MNILKDRWNKMLHRCYNSNNNRYKYYGGRGIIVCSEWHQFEPFKMWAESNGFNYSLSLDRVDNDGNYEPSNCKWSTQEEQSRNRQNTVLTEEIAAGIKWLVNKGRSPIWIASYYEISINLVKDVNSNHSWESVNPKQPNEELDFSKVCLKFEQQSLSKNNTSGHLGVSKKHNKWRAELNHKGKQVLRKSFFTIEEAVACREAKIKELREIDAPS